MKLCVYQEYKSNSSNKVKIIILYKENNYI